MKHLVLDIGGVFYRGWPDEAFWDRWTARTGLSKDVIVDVLSSSPEHRAAQVGRMSADEAFAAAGARLGIDGPVVRALAEEAYLSEFNDRMAEAVRALRAEGVAVSALTNTLSTEAQLQARPEFAGLFEHVVSSHDVGLAKPDPAIFRAALDRLGAAAAETVFVDDLIGHVEAARDLGFTGVHFRTTEQTLAELGAIYPDARHALRIADGIAAARAMDGSWQRIRYSPAPPTSTALSEKPKGFLLDTAHPGECRDPDLETEWRIGWIQRA